MYYEGFEKAVRKNFLFIFSNAPLTEPNEL